MENCRNVIFLILAAMVLFCQVSFADTQGIETITEETVAVALESAPDSYSKEEIDAMFGQIMNSIPEVPTRYTDEEIDEKITLVIKSIPDASGNYTNEEIDNKIVALNNSIPAIPEVYSKEEIKERIRALNDAITTLEIALANIRNSIPAEIKWPVKTKQILNAIRVSIPADLAGARE